MASPIKGVDIPWGKVFLWVALIATIGGALFATKTLSTINKNISVAKEAARPANIKITIITAPDCVDCFPVQSAVENFKKQNVSVDEETSISFDSDQAKSLMKDLGILRAPTYIVTGEVGKKNLEEFIKNNGEVKNNTFVFTKVPPVFLDPETKKEFGKVTATILTDASCPQCFNPKQVTDSYKKAGIKIADIKETPFNSAEGQGIISQYQIAKIPTVLFSRDIDYYDNAKNSWPQIGTIEQDKTYVVRNVPLPYRDLAKDLVVGLVDIVYLTDSTCGGCYDVVKTHRPIITQGLGVGLRSERIVDINSAAGESFVSKYKITKVPTILLSPEMDQYANVKSVWKSVGTVESDGWYAFRELQVLGGMVYKDLATNKIIQPAQSPSANGAEQ